MAIREKIILEGEDRASKSFNTAGGNFEKMGKTLKKVAIAGGIAIAARQLVKLGTTTLNLAVDAAEAESAFETAFGEALPQASKFVDEFANKAGFANFELQQMLAITGTVIQGIGATEEASAALSIKMATLAGDVASFSNASGGAQAVLGALQSAINGEREALKTYGLALSEAEVQTLALTTTGKTRADELTRLEKAEATVTLATEKAGKALGDLDRTQDSAANAMRRFQAKVKEAGVSVGEGLLPVLEELLPIMEDLIPLGEDVGKSMAAMVLAATPTVAAGLQLLPSLLDGLGLAMGAVVNVGAGFTALMVEIATLGFANTEGIQSAAEMAAHGNDIIKITRALRNEQVPGATAATQYANALVTLARSSDLSAGGIAALGLASNATAREQFDALVAVRAFADEKNWRPENIKLVEDAISGLRLEVSGFDLADFNENIIQGGDAGEMLAAAFGGAGEQAVDLAGAIGGTTEALDEAIEKAKEADEAFREELAGGARAFIDGFAELPKKIKISMDEFEKNLTDRISASRGFWDNLTVLAAAGFTGLSEMIRAQGPEAAGLLQDMVDDMDEAAKLDEIIGTAGTEMDNVTAAYADALQGTGGQAALSSMGEYGRDIMDAIADGIRSGDLAGPLMAEINAAVARVTGRSVIGLPSQPGAGGAGSGNISQFAHGTWAVPGRGPIDAVVHGGEIIIPPSGSRNRAQFAAELASEIGRVVGAGRDTTGQQVTIEQILVTVPAGTTINEAITAAGAEAAIEALMS